MKKRLIAALSILLAMACVAGLALYAYLFNRRIENLMQSDTTNFLAELSQQGARNLESKIEDDIQTMQAMAWYAGNVFTDDLDEMVPHLQQLSQINPRFEVVGFILPDGNASNSRAVKYYLGDRQYFKDALQGKVSLSDILSDRVTGKPVNVYAVPVYKNDKIVGVLFGSILNSAYQQLLSVSSFNGLGFSCVANAQGDIVVNAPGRNSLGSVTSLFDLQFADSQQEPALREAFAARGAGLLCYSIEGEDRYLSYTPLEINDWYFIAIVPAKAITQHSDQLMRFTTWTWSFLIVLFVVLITVLVVLFNKRVLKLQDIAYTDTQTGLPTWLKFQLDAKKALSEHKAPTYAMLVGCIDRYMALKDLYGKNGISVRVQQVAQELLNGLQPGEFCARLSENEFVIMTIYHDERSIRERADDFVQRCHANIPGNPLEFSFGVYVIDNPSLPLETIRDRAEIAMAKVRDVYKKNVSFFDETMYREIDLQKKIEQGMLEAIEKKQFLVYYQPKYSLHEETVVGAEALVRWNHPELGFMSPGAFIPIFEANGFITALDLYVFESVCKTMRRWKKAGIHIVPVSINLSRHHLSNGKIVDTLRELMEKYEIDPSYIEIEFIETMLMDFSPAVQDILVRMRALGCTLAIDDFGKDFSSLSLLTSLPVDTLKLDRAFFANNLTAKSSRVIVSNVVRMAQQLSIAVVCEGIETREQVEVLQTFGCDVIQGFYFAKPMPDVEFRRLLERLFKKKF